MSPSIFLRVLAAAVLVGIGIAAVAVWRQQSIDVVETARKADLAAPLPAEAEAELAASLPAIDEFRHHRGSVLDGTFLDADGETPADEAYIELLRREARRLDGLAADQEESAEFDRADEIRTEAAGLRGQARNLQKQSELSGTHFFDYERR